MASAFSAIAAALMLSLLSNGGVACPALTAVGEKAKKKKKKKNQKKNQKKTGLGARETDAACAIYT
jgi:hypothetical protein